MAQLKTHKFVAALPPELEADAIYFVRSGSGFDLYVTNHSGTTVAYPANKGEFAPLASPALAGTPSAPTPALVDNSNTIATTAFVKTALAEDNLHQDPYRFASNSFELPNFQLTPISVTTTLFRYNRWRISIGSWTARKARFLISNVNVSQNTVTANADPIIFEGLFIEIDGVITPITVNGVSAFTIPSGGMIWTDPLAVDIPPNADIFLRSARRFVQGQAWTGTSAMISQQIGDVAQHSSNSLINVANGTTAASNPQIYSPRPPVVAMVARGHTGGPVGLVLGSSGAYGVGWNTVLSDNRREVGYIRRGLGSRTGGRMTGMIAATSGGTTPNTINTLLPWLKQAVAILGETPWNYTHSQLGLNDLGTLAQLQTNVTNLRNYLDTNFGAMPFVMQTLTPTTSGSNTTRWTDETNQTYSNAAFGPDPCARSQTNDWLRTNPSGIVCFDVAPFMAGTVSSKVKVPVWTTTLAAPITLPSATTISTTHAPPVGTILVIEPGSPNMDWGPSGDRLVVQSVTGTGPYTVTLIGGDYTTVGDAKPLRAHDAGVVVATTNTYDGLHYSTLAQIEMADLFAQLKSVLSNAVPPLSNQITQANVEGLNSRLVAIETSTAPLANPTFTGTPTAPTQAAGNNSTRLATTAFTTGEINSQRPKGLSMFCSGKPIANEIVGSGIAPYAMTLSAANSKAQAVVAAAASTVFIIKKNNTNIGTVTFSAAGTIGVISISTTAVATNDLITIHAPASADATLADITIQLRGT